MTLVAKNFSLPTGVLLLGHSQLFEKAQKFVAQRPANGDCERSLLFLELERRFPELKREDVGKLLYYDKKNEGMEGVILPSSYAKRYDRTREDAHIYRKLA